GWELGTPTSRGVRIYPVGSRAERVVPAADVHVQHRASDNGGKAGRRGPGYNP
ncbi:MAG: hypothetical protein QOE92_39, partial [Chloroflexota bacterium]|nr:hypothetical protein [Chloroflexota bacterium]